MVPIRRTNSRVEAIGKIRDMMLLNAPNEVLLEAAKIWRKACDPCTKFLMDQYLEIEKRRMQLLKMAGPLFEGVILSNSNEDANVDVRDDDFALQGVQLFELPTCEGHIVNANKLRGSIKNLSFELVASKILQPIAKAAHELNVSETTLTIWCKISGIPYWPYRKLNSIDMLINTMQEYESDGYFGVHEVEPTIEMLRKEKIAIMKKPSLAMKDTTIAMIKKMHRLASIKKRNLRKDKNNASGILMTSIADPNSHVTGKNNNRYMLGQEQRVKMKDLSFEFVSTKFRMPIEKAAEELHVSRKTLQMWCRFNGIRRWPYRKIQGINALLTNVQQIRRDELCEQGTAIIVQRLEEEKRAIETNPSIAIQASTSSLMKYATKVIMKKRRLIKGNDKIHESS